MRGDAAYASSRQRPGQALLQEDAAARAYEVDGEFWPTPEFNSDAQLTGYIEESIGTWSHPVGTCRMGRRRRLRRRSEARRHRRQRSARRRRLDHARDCVCQHRRRVDDDRLARRRPASRLNRQASFTHSLLGGGVPAIVESGGRLFGTVDRAREPGQTGGPFLGGATSRRRQPARSRLDVSAEDRGEPSAVGLWAISGREEAEGDRITSAVGRAICPRLGARPVWPRWPSGRSSRVRRGSGLPRGRRR